MKALGLILLLALSPLLPFSAQGADVTGGYTFSSGELVTHTKLNAGNAGSINTSFYSGKSSAGSNPNTAFQLLLRNTTSDVFVRSTLAEAIFDHTSLLSARTLLATPEAGDTFMVYDLSALTYKQVALSNMFVGASRFGGVVTNEDLLTFFDFSAGTIHGITMSNLIMGATSLTDVDGGEALLVVTAAGRLRKTAVASLISLSTTNTAGLNGSERFLMLNSANNTRAITPMGLLTNASSVALSDTNFFTTGDGVTWGRVSLATLKSNVNFAPGYVRVREEQTSGTDGGTFTTGAWQVRTLNTLATQNIDGVSISGNLVTLPAGYYNFRAVAPGLAVGRHQLMLTNSTDGAVVDLGPLSRSTTAVSTYAVVSGRFTNASAKAYGLRHRSSATQATTGFGEAGGWGTEVYAQVEFWKD